MTLTYYQILTLHNACVDQIHIIEAGKLNGYSISYLADQKKNLKDCEVILQEEIDRVRKSVIERTGEKK